ncbi:FapA family protein [Hippea sp. KM1]|uniref:FapA family protein n=1 Tax=Hippea sp. KM1 TaxID=944481 RepID=UPI00046D827E|nr:FapA family protein [Hippea sp. KM1]
MEEFQTIERETDNIQEAIEEAATTLGYPKKFLDFEILQEREEKDNVGNIKKVYKIKIFINEKKAKDKLNSIISIETEPGKHPMKAFVCVDTLKLDEPLTDIDESRIIELLKKEIAKNGIVFGVKSKILPAIAQEIRKRLSPSFKPFKILIAEGKKPVRGENSKLIFHFDKYKAAGTIYKNGKIDYKNKNFLVPVKKGQLLIEFFKPTQGEEGYDVLGNILVQDVGVMIDDLEEVKFSPDSVEKIEEGRVVKVISNKDGVIVFKNGIYEIDTSVSIDKVDIKTTGNLNADGDVELEIGSGLNSGIEDTIAAGMKVKGKKVVVNGDVGPKATIEAEEVEIKGSVHQDAFIKAKKAKIAICRGRVEADEIDVDLSEHARLTAKNKVNINKAVATRIFAPKVQINDVMMSSCITTSSDSVLINKVEGGDNIISIKPLELPWIKEKYKELLMKEKYAKTILKGQEKKFFAIRDKIEAEKEKQEDILKTIQKLKKDGKNVPNALLVAVKKFKELQETFKKEKEEYDSIKKEVENLHKQIENLRNSYKDGHIIIKDTIPSNNIIEFDDNLKQVLDKEHKKVKIYVREIQGKESIVIEPVVEDVETDDA